MYLRYSGVLDISFLSSR